MYSLNAQPNTPTSQAFVSTALMTKSTSTDTAINERVSERLAKLSHRAKWVLFTAQCPRPRPSRLRQLRFTAEHVVHIQASRLSSEKEIVLKAMHAGNASAVVASQNISAIDQKHLQQRAKQLGCEVFFVDANSELYLSEAQNQFH